MKIKQEIIFTNLIKKKGFIQIPNKNHSEKDIKRDLGGKYILISECYYYFGYSAISSPSEIRPAVPKGQSADGKRTYNTKKARKFIEYIQNNYKMGIIDYPHNWPRKNEIK